MSSTDKVVWRSDLIFMTIGFIAKPYMAYKISPSPKTFNAWEKAQDDRIKSLKLDFIDEPINVRGLLAIEILEEAMKCIE